jgi:hypothetical protein
MNNAWQYGSALFSQMPFSGSKQRFDIFEVGYTPERETVLQHWVHKGKTIFPRGDETKNLIR